MASDPEFLVDEIFPANEVHLIYGSSGVGKTSWGFPFLCDLHAGLPIFGYLSKPTRCLYLGLDRSSDDIRLSIRRLGLEGKTCRYVGVENLPKQPDIGVIFRAATTYQVQTVFVEGFLRVIRGRSNDYNTVADTITECTRLCKQDRVTVFAVMHTPKSAKSQNGTIPDPVQRVLGSVAFGAYGSTKVLIEAVTPDDPMDARRTITVIPRHTRMFVLDYIRDHKGRMVLAKDERADILLDQELRGFTGDTFDRQTALGWGQKHGLAERTVEMWIQKRLDKSIQRLSRGKYAKLAIQ